MIDVSAHEGLVYQQALRLRKALDPEFDDVVGEGRLGLVQAANTYDPKRGTFANWAVPRIRGAMLDYLRRWDMRVRSDQRNGRPAEYVPLDIDHKHPRPVLFDVRTETVDAVVNAACGATKPRAAVALDGRMQGYFTQEIADVMGVTEGRVSQLCREALNRMTPDPYADWALAYEESVC